MKKLVEDSIAGDRLFLYCEYSCSVYREFLSILSLVAGHGGQTEAAPDDTTEPDGMDEALIPCDAKDDPMTWIIDNVRELQAIVRCFDSPHSGHAHDARP